MQAYRWATELRPAASGAAVETDRPAGATTDLPDREGLAVLISRFGGGSYRDVARLLGVSEAQSRRAMRDGLRRLRNAPVAVTP
jgi:DNA-directed RNA polymerase specialized sigma24 family protein